eukprot:TRINITY_DN12649_c0_g1_i2.p1 TRINITY_DN12649_c0_g1~~TRINITY_DN12649_c0_g1_i2.p1  ORF type:complete len:429 (+),score=75.00 TRINITY_DN12649_c0_g1_i2:306-1592(+)
MFLGRVDDDVQQLEKDEVDISEDVPSTRLVCKAWAAAVWYVDHVDVSGMHLTITDSHVARGLERFFCARSLVMCNCRRVTFANTITQYMHKLERLELSGCVHLTDDILEAMTLCTPLLRELRVASCTRLERMSLNRALDLQVLDIGGCQRVTDSVVEHLTADFAQLKELFLSCLPRIHNPGIRCSGLELLALDRCERVGPDDVTAALERCKDLKVLTLDEMDVPAKLPQIQSLLELSMSGTGVGDEDVVGIVGGFPSLTTVDLSRSERLVEPGLQHALLEVLLLNDCSELTDAAVSMCLKHLPSLRHLACSHCDSLVRPTVESDSLELLDLSGCANLLTDTCQQWIFAPIRSLYIGCSSVLNDRELETAVWNLADTLEYLNVSLSDGVVRPRLTFLRRLTTVCVRECESIDLDWLEKLGLTALQCVHE